MDLRAYSRVLRAHWLLILLSVLVCTAAAGLVAWTRTPTYAGRTQLFVSAAGAPVDPSQTYQGGLFSQQRVLSYAQIMSSPPILQVVIEKLGLPDSLDQLQHEISASVPTGTVLINVTAKDRSPERAMSIANAVATEFSTFVKKLEAGGGGSQTSPVAVTVTRRAELPTSPVSPRKPLYLAGGILLGLVLGVGIAALREALSTRIGNQYDAAEIARAPVLGTIADRPGADRRPLVLVDDPFSPGAEAYRRLRTNLSALGVDRGLRSFVVSSAVQAEGKTTVVANLGIAFAQVGLRTVLVDADLHRPRLAGVLGLSSRTGLTNVLAQDGPLDSALQTWRPDVPLELIASGPLLPNPSELLVSRQFIDLVATLTDRFDVVICDAPAVLPLTDAAILARVTSGAILVTRFGSTRESELEDAANSLRTVGAELLGVVLSRAPSRSLSSYQAYTRDPHFAAGQRAVPNVAKLPSAWEPEPPKSAHSQ